MSSHEISVSTVGRSSGFVVLCSCGGVLLFENIATVDELTDIAHKHIEEAERGYAPEPAAWCQIPGHKHRTSRH